MFFSCCVNHWVLHWRHNDHDGVSNHQPHDCLLNRLFKRRSRKTSKIRVTGLCVGNLKGPMNSPHKGPVTRKMFPFDDVIMRMASFNMLRARHDGNYLDNDNSKFIFLNELFEFGIKFQLSIICSGNDLASYMWLINHWNHEDRVHWCIFASHGLNMLNWE